MKNAVLSGCDRGLGLAMTKELLGDGWRVFAGQFMPEWPELDQLKEQWGDQLIIMPLDVSSDKSVEDAAKIVRSYTDRIELLMNIAGIMASTMGKEGTDERSANTNDGTIFDKPNMKYFMAMYNVNALGQIRMNHNFIDLLVKGEGDKTLVNISSEAGSCSFPTCARDFQYGYCMSKAAVNCMSAMLQYGLKKHEIKVFNLHPGYLRSYIIAGGKPWADINAIKPEYAAWNINQLIKTKRDLDEHIYLNYDGIELPW